MEIGGEKVVAAPVLDHFGFVTMERKDGGWTATVRDVNGKAGLECAVSDLELSCG